MTEKVTFLIDGFNLYHSAKDASNNLGLRGRGTKWLDIRAVCESFLPQISKAARLEEIHYFSALAVHLDAAHPDKTNRHRIFIQCLEDTGVEKHLSRFKPNPIRCRRCRQTWKRYEEKETDVALASKMLELLVSNSCDTILLLTGDTDLAPAIKSARIIAPEKHLGFIFPFKRKNKELAKMSDFSFNLKPNAYTKHQFQDPRTIADGTVISKPNSW